ncbi:Uncharacterised protein [Candidatus Tiddalikarchaeum anstoanum]|nr:Uncharacterised protein [Candidatus Tiddalikarchaeum anstoanum]
MNQNDIVTFLRMQKANDPEAYEKYMAEYKEKNPDFYKTVLIPALEPQKTEKKAPTTYNNVPNPAEMLATDVQPIGSANVGELNYGAPEQQVKKEAANEKPKSEINRRKPPIKIILIIAAILIVAGVMVAIFIR